MTMSKTLLLHIETSGEICSVCLTQNGEVLSELSAIKERSHSKRLTLLIQELCIACDVRLKDLSGVVLSKGPGSYTGLRVGSSVSKGICYSLEIPLIAINTLTAMASQYCDESKETLIVPMLLARKEEVYLKVLNGNLDILQVTTPTQLTKDFLEPYLTAKINRIVVCSNVTELARVHFPNLQLIEYHQLEPTALNLTYLSYDLFQRGKFNDIAYFDLDYIKSPNITTTKKKSLIPSIVKN